MTKRLQRINELLRQQISQILLKEINFNDGLITITRVETSTNLKQTKVMISVMPREKGLSVLQILKRNIFNLQQIVNKKLNMRPVPKISFEIDESEAKTQRIEELLKKVSENSSL